MACSETNLVKLLEYGKMAPPKRYEAIASVLDLEFYSEHDGHAPVYTICSSMFVLDISEDTCSLIFVDESRGPEFDVVQKYLSAYLHSPLVFFHVLRFFVRCVDLAQAPGSVLPDDAAGAQRDLRRHKVLCSCVFDGAHCLGRRVSGVPRGYNIFTHRNEDGLYNPVTCRPAGDAGKVDAGLCVSPNLHDYFTPDGYSMGTPGAFAEPSRFYYASDSVRAVGGDVFVDGERCKVASFVFKKGGTLADAVDASRTVRRWRGGAR